MSEVHEIPCPICGCYGEQYYEQARFECDRFSSQHEQAGYARAIADVAAWLRELDIEPLPAGEEPVCGSLIIEMGCFGMIAHALDSGAWKEQG